MNKEYEHNFKGKDDLVESEYPIIRIKFYNNDVGGNLILDNYDSKLMEAINSSKDKLQTIEINIERIVKIWTYRFNDSWSPYHYYDVTIEYGSIKEDKYDKQRTVVIDDGILTTDI